MIHRKLIGLTLLWASSLHAATNEIDHSAQLAKAVTIHRDEWGVAHVLGPTDESVIFGMGFVQSEDYFWQLEDTTIQAVGRYAEVTGESGFESDLLNRSFQVVQRSKADFEKLTAEQQRLIAAFTHGINWYLKHHPQTRLRLIERFEPWMVLAIDRHLLLDFTYGRTHAGGPRVVFGDNQKQPAIAELSPLAQAAREAIGSNEWAIGPAKTASGKSMLLINPHQPWHGWGQFYEVHLHSDETIQFSGACFFGTPIPTLGHNENLGWTYTVNTPDNADSWRVVFDKPDEPLAYRFDDKYRTASQWQDSIGIRSGTEVEFRDVTFRETHHGPIVRRVDETTFLAANVDGIFDLRRVEQMMGMVRAKNLMEWKQAVGNCALPMFNIAYADREGNILYVYNGSIPVRDPAFDWRSPVDGTTSATDWQGRHSLDDLPQLLNPKCGYVQNCNTSPFTTTDSENPDREKFPSYMFEDADHSKRRAQLSRKLLSESADVTFEQFQALAFDTSLYWPATELSGFKQEFDKLVGSNSDAALQVKPYLDHLLDWDCRSSVESTQTTLCIAWYEELHEGTYPGETLKKRYADSPSKQLGGLVTAAKSLKSLHGDWQVPWGSVHRLQRVRNKPDVVSAAYSFNGLLDSLPCPGVPGPLGVVYTVYSTPSVPLVRPTRYAVVGSCYVGVVEFGDKVRAASAVQFGASSDLDSEHYFDQARLFSEQKLKPAWFYREDVVSHAIYSYHPGEAIE